MTTIESDSDGPVTGELSLNRYFMALMGGVLGGMAPEGAVKLIYNSGSVEEMGAKIAVGTIFFAGAVYFLQEIAPDHKKRVQALFAAATLAGLYFSAANLSQEGIVSRNGFAPRAAFIENQAQRPREIKKPTFNII